MVALIPAIVLYDMGGSRDTLLVIFLTYGAMSPVLVLLFMIIRYNMISRITVTGTDIEAVSPGVRIQIPWQSVTHFVYDFISVTKGGIYVIYEVSGNNEMFRFNSLVADEEKLHTENIYQTDTFNRKSFSFSSYGLYLDRKSCDRLVRSIADYTGKEPERRQGMF